MRYIYNINILYIIIYNKYIYINKLFIKKVIK